MKRKILLIIPLLLFIFQSSTSQQKSELVKLRGIVRTGEEKPVANAFIFIDGQIIEDKTNTNGKFRIQIPDTAEIISVFTIDNRFAEQKIDGRKNISLTLSEPLDTTAVLPAIISQDVVSLGYYKSQIDKLTSSVGVVKSKEGEENYYDNIYDMIKGELPGVSVVGNSITIRGPGSLRSSNEPLFVVDGMPVNSVAHIVPANVESISVLRGAAANMYGSRGSNGVIVIELKSGNRK
ncbi:MAG: TonB-dependent receptor plug domain-containing protein [Bacteroidales bacterium]|nr:TonB-dependent receptor plug domain-containing protein [Bacteroidales bacterium]